MNPGKIPVKNIYYMLSYAYSRLRTNGYSRLASEEFENSADLCAAILALGITDLVRHGLGHDYLPREEILGFVRGKIDISSSLKHNDFAYHRLTCSYDEFSTDIYLNQILKTTMLLLIHRPVSKIQKHRLRRLIPYFSDISELDYHHISWPRHYTRQNRSYELLIPICELVIKAKIQSQTDHTMNFLDIFDDQKFSRLYEKFLLEYYKKEHPEIHVSAPFIKWHLDPESPTDMLPVMKSDVYLEKGNKVLIIDAKRYNNNLGDNRRFISRPEDLRYTLSSPNLYQIYTYVKNEALNRPNCQISGLLLYAKTSAEVQPFTRYSISGNPIGADTLDLNCNFSEIRSQLDKLIERL